VNHNKQWLVSYIVRDHTAVTRRTANGSFLGIAAEGFAVDTALSVMIAALRLEQRAPLLRLDKLGSTLTRVFSNSEAALVSFDVIHTACQKGWDAAVVVRLLCMWLQSQQGKGADVIAVIAQQNDCVALRALVQVYALCDARYRGSDDSDTDSDAGADEDTVGSKTAYEQCSPWLEGAVVSMCDLQTVTDKCHLADEELVLTAVAAARIAQRCRYTVGLRARRMQLYAQSRHNAAAAKAATATVAATTHTANRGAVLGAMSQQWQRLRSGAAAGQQKQGAGRKRASVADTAVSNNDDAELIANGIRDVTSADQYAEGFACDNKVAVPAVAVTASTDSADTDTATAAEVNVRGVVTMAASSVTLTSGSNSQEAETAQLTAAATGAVSSNAAPQMTAQQRLTSAWRAFRNEHPGEQQALAQLHEATGSNAVLRRERDALDNKHTQAVATVAELQAIVNTRDIDVQRLEQQLTDECGQHAATRVDLTSIGAALITAESKLVTATSAVSDMKTEVCQLKRQLAYTELRLTASAAQSTVRRDALYALQWRLDERDRQLGERNSIIDSVQLQLSSERTAHAATQSELGSVSEQMVGLTGAAAQLAASEVQLANNETLLTATNAELAAAVAECDSVRVEATAQQQKCSQQVAERDNTISSLRQELLDERSTHAATRAELVSAAEQLSGFAGTTAQLADSDRKLAAAVRRAEDAEVEAAALTAQLNTINGLLQQRDATVSQQLTSLTESAAELASTKAELTATQAALATAVTECGTVATEAAAQQLRSNQQFAERDSTINSLSQQLTGERHQHTVTRRELADTKATLSSTVAALATAELKLTTALTAASDAAADSGKVKRLLVRTELQLFSAAAQSKVLRNEALAAQQQLNERDHQLAEQSSAVSSVQQQLNGERSAHTASTSELARVSDELIRLTGIEAKLVDTDVQLAAAVSRTADVQREAAVLVDALHNCQQLLQQRDSAMSSLQQQLDGERIAHAATNDRLTSMSHDLSTTAAKLTSTKLELTATAASLTSAVVQCDTVKAEVAALQMQHSEQLTEQYSSVDKLEHQLETASSELAAIRGGLCSSEAQRVSAVNEAASLAQEVKTLTLQLTDMKSEHTAQAQDVAARANASELKADLAQSTLAATAAQLADTETKWAATTAQLVTVEATVSSMTADLAATVVKSDAVQQEAATLKQQLAERDQQLSECSSEANSREQQCTALADKITALSAQLTDSEQCTTSIRTELTAAKEHLEACTAEVAQRDASIANLEKELQSARSTLQDVMAETKSHWQQMERLTTAESELAAAVTELKDTKAELAAAVTCCGNLQQATDLLKAQLQAAADESVEHDATVQRLEQRMSSTQRQLVSTRLELTAVSEQLLVTCGKLDAHEAKAAEVASKLSDIKKREEKADATAAKCEGIKRELRTLRKRDAEHDAALQQCRDDAIAAAAATQQQLKAVTEQFEELEERSVCVVCQHDPKQVLLQPCLHLCLCTKCSKSPKIKDCPLCRAAIDYKETVHLC
jgi:chromosome segregation ATPase